jgi:hypothetical protein
VEWQSDTVPREAQMDELDLSFENLAMHPEWEEAESYSHQYHDEASGDQSS